MDLLGTPFLLGVVALGLGVCLATALLWNRWPRVLVWPGRAAALTAVMLVGALLAGTFVNRSFAFYTTVDDLIATPARTYQPPAPEDPSRAAGVQVLTPGWQSQGQRRAALGQGSLLDVQITGARSGIRRDGLVYLPAAWFLRGRPVLPTLELFHGYPGNPGNYRDQLDLRAVLDREIRAQRMPPVVAVVPRTYQGRASECVDAVHGEPDETYLAVDVPAAVQRTFSTLPGRSLGLLGYSEGGFCALNLGLHHPDRVAAAASLSGYVTAGTDPHTRDLYRGAPGALQRNSPLWWVQHREPTAPALLLVASRGDPDSVAQDRLLRRAARQHARRLPLSLALLPSGGHDFSTWAAALPGALDVLGHHLPMPLAPAVPLPPDPGASRLPAPAAGRAGRR